MAGTIFVSLILIAAVSAIVVSMIKGKKAGKGCPSCGGHCSCCKSENN